MRVSGHLSTDLFWAAYDANVAAYRQSVLGAFQEVEDNLSSLRILDEESVKQNQAVQSAEHSLGLSTNRYKGGLVTYLEVTTAQSAALTNERASVDLLTRRMASTVLLITALGGGWAAASFPNSRLRSRPRRQGSEKILFYYARAIDTAS